MICEPNFTTIVSTHLFGIRHLQDNHTTNDLYTKRKKIQNIQKNKTPKTWCQ